MVNILTVLRLLAVVITATAIVALGADIIALGLSDKPHIIIDPLYVMTALVIGGSLVFFTNDWIAKIENRHYVYF